MVSLSTETISDFSNWKSCQVVFYKWSYIKMSKALIQWNSATNCDTFVRSLEVRRGQIQCAIGSHHHWYFIYCSMITCDFRKVRTSNLEVWPILYGLTQHERSISTVSARLSKWLKIKQMFITAALIKLNLNS